MKDLKKLYLQMADALEKRFTSREDKHTAAIMLRNATVELPHCYFCGQPEITSYGNKQYASRYHPTARICYQCVCEVARDFGLLQVMEPQSLPVSDLEDTQEVGIVQGAQSSLS
jgi:hypothetical protein